MHKKYHVVLYRIKVLLGFHSACNTDNQVQKALQNAPELTIFRYTIQKFSGEGA